MNAQRAPTPRTDHSNVVLWLVFCISASGSGAFFLVGLHPRIGSDALFAAVAVLGRAVLFVAAGLTLEALLLRSGAGYFTVTKARRSVLHAYWVTVMFCCVALAVDVLLYAFAGYHLPTAARILFSDGPAGVGQVVEATGLSVTVVLFSLSPDTHATRTSVGIRTRSRGSQRSHAFGPVRCHGSS